MAYPKLPPQIAWLLVLVISCAVSALLVMVMILTMPGSKEWLAAQEVAGPAPADEAPRWPRAGVLLVLRDAAGAEVIRTLPAASFSLAAGEPFDLRLPASAVEAELRITPRPGRIRDAHLGVQFSGGQVIVRSGEQVIIADAAGDEVREAMTPLPINLRPSAAPLSITFRRRGDGAALLRTMWRPEPAIYALRFPADGQALGSDAIVRGHVLMTELRCTACHVPDDPQRRAALAALPAATLEGVGSRVRGDWLEAFVSSNPNASSASKELRRCGISSDALSSAAQADLAAYLSSLTQPAEGAGAFSTPGSWPSSDVADLISEGAHLFHTAGCVACHGPLEPAKRFIGVSSSGTPTPGRYAELGDLAAKYAPTALAAYLRDPVAVHPDGRMPSLSLTAHEAAAIAAYLVGDPRDAGEHAMSGAPESSALDAAAVARGAQLVASGSCLSCHAAPEGLPAAPRAQRASSDQSLETILARGSAGCLQTSPAPPAFDAGLNRWQQEDLRAWMDALLTAEPQSGGAWRMPAHDQLAADMLRLRCTACHAYHADRGPEPAILAYFTSREDADLGDEGRIPPELTDAGGRLSMAWMHEAMSGRGRARPWLATRMPVYGDAHVAHLPGAFAAAAGASALLSKEPTPTATAIPDGLRLVGVRGLNCIECHGVAGHPSVGMPGPDLTQMPERLLYSAFAQWMADPALLRPGTRMPSFFSILGSPVTDVCGGWPECQIESMWTYLSLGALAPLPEGFPDPAGFDIPVTDEPVIFRSFMSGAGFRAIAVGFPQGMHAAYDPDRGEFTALWRGRFLSARGAWGGRGGMLTDPDLTDWALPPGQRIIMVLDDAGSEMADDQIERRFHGYRLDAQRVPEFESSLRIGDQTVRVFTRAEPSVDRRGAVRMNLRIRLEGPVGMRLRAQAPGAAISVPLPGNFELDAEGGATILIEIPGS